MTWHETMIVALYLVLFGPGLWGLWLMRKGNRLLAQMRKEADARRDAERQNVPDEPPERRPPIRE